MRLSRSYRHLESRLVIVLASATGVLTGLSFGTENQEVYVPPGLRLLRPDLLAADWWASSAVHYHWAYSGIVAFFEALGILPWGLALSNAAAVTATLLVVFSLIRLHDLARPLVPWLIVLTYYYAFAGYRSVAASYLFSAAFQSSTVATVATIYAWRLLYSGQYLKAGVALAVGGCFHANFLILNMGLFGLWICLAFLGGEPGLTVRGLVSRATRLLGPSVAVVLATMPLILRVAGAPGETGSAIAWPILFDFAVPIHYRPTRFTGPFLVLAGLQLLGLAWTARATRPGPERIFWGALQGSLAILLWLGTALSTVPGADAVTRLFIWRLAPFAVLVAIMMFAIGTARTLQGPAADRKELGLTLVSASLAGVLLGYYYHTRYGLLDAHALTILLLPVIVHLLVLWKWLGLPLLSARCPKCSGSLVAAGFTVLLATMVSGFIQPERYNLIVSTPAERAREELYAWARQATADQSVFLVPPQGLDAFRLKAERAIVADWKAVPHDPDGLVEWYDRLEAISGTRQPRSVAEVVEGYQRLDEERLALIQHRYGITYAVLTPEMGSAWDGWRLVFDNGQYRVIGQD